MALDGRAATLPRTGKALRDGWQVTRPARSAGSARPPHAPACFGLRTPEPTTGGRAHRARAGLRAAKAQPGIEPTCGFLPDPRSVQSRVLQQPERLEALGRV